MIGHFRDMSQDFQKTGDVKSNSKSFKERMPNGRFKVTNLGASPFILLRDPELIKEFVSKPQLYAKHPFCGRSPRPSNRRWISQH